MPGVWIKERKIPEAVVFVHGILSSGESCWLNENGSYWPDLLRKSAELDSFGIYVFTYKTGFFSGNYQLGDIVDALKEHLRLDGILDCNTIIFVCHSMGGIVSRRFLVQREAELLEKKIKVGLFLVASPSLGSAYADLLKGFARILGNSQADALRFIRNNAWLNDLDKDFQNLLAAGRLPIRGKELVEDRFLVLNAFFRTEVVEPFSGARYFGESFKVPDSTHSSIAKPDNGNAIQHRLLHLFIKELLEQPDKPPAQQTKTAAKAEITRITPIAHTPATNHEPLSSFRNERQREFENGRMKCRVFAKSTFLAKECDPLGNSTLHYFLEELTAEGSEEVTSLQFLLGTSAGLVCSPRMDDAADFLGVSWHPDEKGKPQSFSEVLDHARTLKGAFHFREPLTQETGPYSFGWSVTIYNSDAMTRWEFENLYPEHKDRLHVDGRLVDPPQEFLARLAWLPAARLSLSVQLPPGQKGPVFHSFAWSGPRPVGKKDVLDKGVLLSRPNLPSANFSVETLWQAKPRHDRLEAECLESRATGEHVLNFPHPLMGTWYSLDWRLREHRPQGASFRMMKDSEAVRSRLIEHRSARQARKQTPHSQAVIEILGSLHRGLRQKFPQGYEGEIFESCFFSYDAASRLVVVCESFRGDGELNPAAALDFSLNFGMGLAGACFRAGTGMFSYNKSNAEALKEPYPYLPCPGQPAYEYLLALPINHPEFTPDAPSGEELERSRQLIGVLTISSDYGPSLLQRLCSDPPSSRNEYEQWLAEASAFRKECQLAIDPLSRLLLRPTGQ